MFRFYLSAFYVDLKGSLHLFNLSDFILLMFILIWAPVVGYFQFWFIPLSVVGAVVLCYVVWRWIYRPPDEPQKNGAKPSLSAGEAEGKGLSQAQRGSKSRVVLQLPETLKRWSR